MRDLICNLLCLLYVPEAAAKERGMTHEGTVFWVPVWLAIDGDNLLATPKVPALELWCWLCDAATTAATYFMTEDQFLALPLTIGRPLE